MKILFWITSLVLVAVFLCGYIIGQDVTFYVVTKDTTLNKDEGMDHSFSPIVHLLKGTVVYAGPFDNLYDRFLMIPKDGKHVWYKDVGGTIQKKYVRNTISLQLSRPKNYTFSRMYRSDWIEVSSSDNASYEVDPSRMLKSGNVISFWLKAEDKKDNSKISMEKNQANCVTKKSRSIQRTNYKRSSGNDWIALNSPSSSHTPRSIFVEVIPETVGEEILLAICSL